MVPPNLTKPKKTKKCTKKTLALEAEPHLTSLPGILQDVDPVVAGVACRAQVHRRELAHLAKDHVPFHRHLSSGPETQLTDVTARPVGEGRKLRGTVPCYGTCDLSLLSAPGHGVFPVLQGEMRPPGVCPALAEVRHRGRTAPQGSNHLLGVSRGGRFDARVQVVLIHLPIFRVLPDNSGWRKLVCV